MNYSFTIGISTYNREKKILENLKHLEKQTYKNFEVIVVDDGSTDQTRKKIEEFQNKTKLKIRYFFKLNGGKYTAFNQAVELAKGDFFINCDSDDYLDYTALERLNEIYNGIPEVKKEKIAGIIGLNCSQKTNKITGEKFPSQIKFSNPLIIKYKYKIKGDKFVCTKRAILLENRFPTLDNCKFIPESYLLNRVSKKFDYFYVNEIFKKVEYMENGITNQGLRYRVNNLEGVILCYEDFIMNCKKFHKIRGALLNNYSNYIRFNLHSKKKMNIFLQRIDVKRFDYMVIGFLLYIRDLYYLRK